MHHVKCGLVLVALLSCAGLGLPIHADAQTRERVAAGKTASDGSQTAGSASVATGPRGAAARGGVVRKDTDGGVQGGSAAVVANDQAAAARTGRFQKNTDGSFQREGAAAAGTAAGGRAATAGSVSGDGQGGIAGARRTSVQSAAGHAYEGDTNYATGEGVQHGNTVTTVNGASAQGNVSAQQGSGVSRSRTCYDAAGQVIDCPN